ncbi:MAG: exodeoxyribonuclease VII large subunit [Ruminococcaceae bacterium]|nr:exodeoxyribonuclease VII large subunit [Oscillospiraceae bacterium]
MNGTRQNALTVEQLNTYIKDYLGTSPLLNKVFVKGEISNLRVYGGSGHIYFTLKDENSSIPATMFGGASKLKFKPENGMKVVCLGRVAVFVRDGQYRIYAEEMEPDGIGSLYIAFEQLKAKLQQEGLFAPEHKKRIPKIPFSVGVITAPGGAAVRDMINVTQRRFPAARIYLYPSLVQGSSAPAQLINAIKTLDKSKLCDVIIIGRGGGSAEDLWCFNDEALAHAVYECETPIISAVGHETDFTICDFVADLRAPTPSAAAELAVPDVKELKKQFSNVEKRMLQHLSSRTDYLRQRLNALAQRPVLQSPKGYFDDRRMALAREEERLFRILESRLEREKMKLFAQSEKLKSLNPLAVLERGFSVAFTADGKAVKSVSELPEGTEFNLKLSDGSVSAVAKG